MTPRRQTDSPHVGPQHAAAPVGRRCESPFLESPTPADREHRTPASQRRRTLVIGLLMLLAGFGGPTSAAEPALDAQSWRVQEVPADDPASWPPGDRKRVDRGVLEAYLRAHRDNELPAPVGAIESCSYEARLEGESLVGSAQGVVRLQQPAPGLVRFGQPGLAIASLTIQGAEAFWGADALGQMYVYCPDALQEFQLEWSLRGRLLHSGMEFVCTWPPAKSTRLRLLLPEALRLDVQGGLIVDRSPAGEGETAYAVEIGVRGRTTLRFRPSAPAPATLLCDLEQQVLASTSRIEVQADLSVRSDGPGPLVLRLPAPGVLNVSSATLQSGETVPLHRDPAEGGVITLDLGEVETDQQTLVRLHATQTVDWTGPVEVPRLAPADAWLTGERWRISTAPEIELEELLHPGLLLEGLSDDDRQETWSLTGSLNSPHVTLIAGPAARRIDADVLGWAPGPGAQPDVRLDVLLSSRQSKAFEWQCMLPHGWAIVEVRGAMGGAAGVFSNWEVIDSPESTPRLRIELPSAVTPTVPARLQLVLRGALPAGDLSGARDAWPSLAAAGLGRMQQTLLRRITPGATDARELERSAQFVAPPPGWRRMPDAAIPADWRSRLGGTTAPGEVVEAWSPLSRPSPQAVIGGAPPESDSTPPTNAGPTALAESTTTADPLAATPPSATPPAPRDTPADASTAATLSSAAPAEIANAPSDAEPRADTALHERALSAEAAPSATPEAALQEPGDSAPGAAVPDAAASVGDEIVAVATIETLLGAAYGPEHLHTLRLLFDRPVDVRNWSAPFEDDVEVLNVLADGRPVELLVAPRSLRLPDRSTPARVLQVQYRSTATAGWLRCRDRIPTPKFPVTILQWSWRVEAPPSRRIEAAPAAAALASGLPELSGRLRWLGPLARPADEPLFNPLDADHWRAVWRGAGADAAPPGEQRDASDAAAGRTTDARIIAGPSSRSRDQDDRAAGAQVMSAFGIGLPASIEIATWNVDRLRWTALAALFGSLLAGLVARKLSRTAYRPASVVVAALATAAWIAPNPLALITGGAVWGMVTAFLIPRRMIASPTLSSSSREPSAPGSPGAPGSTGSSVGRRSGFATAGLLLGASLAASLAVVPGARGQTPRSQSDTRASQADGDSAPAEAGRFNPADAPGTHDAATKAPSASDARLRSLDSPANEPEILLPVKDGVPLGEALLRPDLAGSVERWWRERRPPVWLVRSSRIHVDVGPRAATAEIRLSLVRFAHDRSLKIVLPLEGATFPAVDSASLDGAPTPVVPAVDQPGIVLAWPAAMDLAPSAAEPGSHAGPTAPSVSEVVLRCSLKPIAQPGSRGFDLLLPSTPGARMQVAFAAGLPEFWSCESSGRVAVQGPALEIALGGRPRAVVRWRDADESPAAASTVSGRAESVITVSPRLHRLRTRLILEAPEIPDPFAAPRLDVHLPAGAVVLSAQGETVHEWSTAPGADGVILSLELSAPAAAGQSFDVMFLAPSEHHLATVSPGETTPPRDENTSVVLPTLHFLAPGHLSVHQVGLEAPPLYELRMLTPPEPARGLWELDPADAAPQARRVFGRSVPALACELERPQQLLLELAPRVRQATTELDQSLAIAGDELIWVGEARITATGAPSLIHEFTLAPEIDIDSASVRQGEVERLIRHRRQGDRLQLLLRDARPGELRVLITGRMPAPLDSQWWVPPSFSFRSGAAIASTIRLLPGPEGRWEVLGGASSPGVPAAEGPVSEAAAARDNASVSSPSSSAAVTVEAAAAAPARNSAATGAGTTEAGSGGSPGASSPGESAGGPFSTLAAAGASPGASATDNDLRTGVGPAFSAPRLTEAPSEQPVQLRPASHDPPPMIRWAPRRPPIALNQYARLSPQGAAAQLEIVWTRPTGERLPPRIVLDLEPLLAAELKSLVPGYVVAAADSAGAQGRRVVLTAEDQDAPPARLHIQCPSPLASATAQAPVIVEPEVRTATSTVAVPRQSGLGLASSTGSAAPLVEAPRDWPDDWTIAWKQGELLAASAAEWRITSAAEQAPESAGVAYAEHLELPHDEQTLVLTSLLATATTSRPLRVGRPSEGRIHRIWHNGELRFSADSRESSRAGNPPSRDGAVAAQPGRAEEQPKRAEPWRKGLEPIDLGAIKTDEAFVVLVEWSTSSRSAGAGPSLTVGPGLVGFEHRGGAVWRPGQGLRSPWRQRSPDSAEDAVILARFDALLTLAERRNAPLPAGGWLERALGDAAQPAGDLASTPWDAEPAHKERLTRLQARWAALQPAVQPEGPTRNSAQESAASPSPETELIAAQLAAFHMASADRHARLISADGPSRAGNRLPPPWDGALLGGLWFVGVAVILRRGLKLIDRWRLPDWMAAHPPVVVGAAGLFWWALCTPGVLGALAFAGALFAAIVRRPPAAPAEISSSRLSASP